LLIGFVCFRIMLKRPIAIGEPLPHASTDLQWRVRYAGGKLSQTFNEEMAEKHRKVFGGEVIRSADYGGRLHRK
jgi:hypothetical protein